MIDKVYSYMRVDAVNCSRSCSKKQMFYFKLLSILLIIACNYGALVVASNGAVAMHHRHHHDFPIHSVSAQTLAQTQLETLSGRRHEQLQHESTSVSVLPACERYHDNIGHWVKKSILAKRKNDKNNHQSHAHKLSQYFHEGKIGQALSFEMVWLPHNCSYRRFDNTTLLEAVEQLIIKNSPPQTTPSNSSSPITTPILHTVFFGDSALRGIFCAIYRIYMGSETEGPCMNDICGYDEKRREISIPRIHRPRTVMIGEHWQITFYYVKSFHIKQLSQLIAQVIDKDRPTAVILHTAAWDFYEYNKRHRDEVATSHCHNNATNDIADLRANEFVAEQVLMLAQLARRTIPFLSRSHTRSTSTSSINSKDNDNKDKSDNHHVRLIYRNSHYNRRFGALCADAKFEPLLFATPHHQHNNMSNDSRKSSEQQQNHQIWELWDNRAISDHIWQNQTYDGFHFDWPILTYTVADHRKVNAVYRQRYGQTPGMLAMQLAQSLLNNLFHEVLPLLS